MVELLLLNAKYCSGRAVKVKRLSPAEKDAASLCAAKLVSKEATMVEYTVAQTQEFLQRSIVACSRATGLANMDEVLALKPTDWIKLDVQKLCLEGEFNYSKLFTAKDDDILSRYVNQLYTAGQAEVDAIVGKALAVSED